MEVGQFQCGPEFLPFNLFCVWFLVIHTMIDQIYLNIFFSLIICYQLKKLVKISLVLIYAHLHHFRAVNKCFVEHLQSLDLNLVESICDCLKRQIRACGVTPDNLKLFDKLLLWNGNAFLGSTFVPHKQHAQELPRSDKLKSTPFSTKDHQCI